MKKVFGVLLVLVILGTGIWYQFYDSKTHKKSANAEAKKHTRALYATVKMETIVDRILVSGEITPDARNSVEVKAEISGKIKKIYPTIGKNVKAGSTLVELDDRDLLTEKSSAQTEIEGTQLSLDKAKRLFDRSDKLYAKKLISQEEYENSKTDFLVAQNNFEKSQSRLQGVLDKLDKTQIRSPMDGKVIALPVVAGQVVVGAGSVNAGTSLMTVADLSKMIINCHINQVDIAHLQENQPVTFRVDSLRKDKLQGSINIIAPIATSKNNVKGYDVLIQIQDLDPQIRPGMTADVIFPIKTVEQALTLPLNAVYSDELDNKVVYIPQGPEIEPEKRVITLGIVTLDKVEVLSGVKEGEQVFLEKPKMSDK
ncbi:MAG: efflux RND transporter periplasmic adaptor subunit [Verrucomicrobiota bacterium]